MYDAGDCMLHGHPVCFTVASVQLGGGGQWVDRSAETVMCMNEYFVCYESELEECSL